MKKKKKNHNSINTFQTTNLSNSTTQRISSQKKKKSDHFDRQEKSYLIKIIYLYIKFKQPLLDNYPNIQNSFRDAIFPLIPGKKRAINCHKLTWREGSYFSLKDGTNESPLNRGDSWRRIRGGKIIHGIGSAIGANRFSVHRGNR